MNSRKPLWVLGLPRGSLHNQFCGTAIVVRKRRCMNLTKDELRTLCRIRNIRIDSVGLDDEKVCLLHLQRHECLQFVFLAVQIVIPLRFRGGIHNDKSRTHRRGRKGC